MNECFYETFIVITINAYVLVVTGVSAEWVDARFSSLRVTVPEGGTYRISYSAVNKSNAPKPKVITTESSSQVANGFRPDCFYTVFVEPVPSDSGIGIGE